MSRSDSSAWLGLGVVGTLGLVYAAQRANNAGYKQVIGNYHETPPKVRTPIGGNDSYGYFTPYWAYVDKYWNRPTSLKEEL